MKLIKWLFMKFKILKNKRYRIEANGERLGDYQYKKDAKKKVESLKKKDQKEKAKLNKESTPKAIKASKEKVTALKPAKVLQKKPVRKPVKSDRVMQDDICSELEIGIPTFCYMLADLGIERKYYMDYRPGKKYRNQFHWITKKEYAKFKKAFYGALGKKYGFENGKRV